MQYYNADGSYGGMCGNGGRCAAMFAYRAGYAPSSMRFEALDFTYKAEIIGEEVELFMKDPTALRAEPGLQSMVPGAVGAPVFLSTGSPHLVIRVNDAEAIDVFRLGKMLRSHTRFAPEGTNVNFFQKDGPSSLTLRTYERGVEAETLACGTGSVASAVAAVAVYGCVAPVSVRVRSGEQVVVGFQKEGEMFTKISLKGSAHIIFSGKVLYDETSHKLSGGVGE